MKNVLSFSFGLLSILTLTLRPSAAATTCESLADLKLSNTTITTAQTLAAGAFTPPSSEGGMPMAVSYKGLPAFCRVPASSSRPANLILNLRSGCQPPGGMENFRGSATAVSPGRSLMPGTGRRPLARLRHRVDRHRTQRSRRRLGGGHPEKIVDYGHRAIHEMTEKAKEVIRAFYRDGPSALTSPAARTEGVRR